MSALLRNTSVRLCINDRQDYYVSGDVVRGKLIFGVAQAQISVKKASVYVSIKDSVNMGSPKIYVNKYSIRDEFFLELNIGDLKSGFHIIPFEYVLPEYYDTIPPSTMLEDVGDKYSGVKWFLMAKVIISQGNTAPKAWYSMAHIQVSQNISTVRLAELRERTVRTVRLSEHLSLICDLPRSIEPTTYNICFTVVPRVPMLIDYVDVMVLKRVIKWHAVSSCVLEKTRFIGRIDYGEMVKDKLFVDIPSRRWQVKEAPRIRTRYVHSVYQLSVTVGYQEEGMEQKCKTCILTDIDYLPLSVCRHDAGTESVQHEPLPAYSELSEPSGNVS